ncbi:hypothetical protein ACJX0J_034518, partial [Zea mays]
MGPSQFIKLLIVMFLLKIEMMTRRLVKSNQITKEGLDLELANLKHFQVSAVLIWKDEKG